MKKLAGRLNNRFEMADKTVTDPEDSNYSIQRTERRNEIKGQK